MSTQPYLALIDHQTNGQRCDVTPLFADYAAFSALVDDLAALVEPLAFDVVAGIDALGFILGAALALRTHAGFVPIRKGGKLPVAVDIAECVDYTGQRKTLELRRGALRLGTRALVVDEWIETGAQVRAAIQLIERQGGVIAGIASLHMDDNAQTEPLRALPLRAGRARYVELAVSRESGEEAVPHVRLRAALPTADTHIYGGERDGRCAMVEDGVSG